VSAVRRPAAAPCAFRASPCGGLRMTIAGSQAVLRASGALWLEDFRALVVADLHLEKGSSYAARGQLLPPYDTAETLARLDTEVIALRPDVVVFLGDSFHDRQWEDRIASGDAARLRGLAAGRSFVWVVGNHDADTGKAMPGEVVEQLLLAGLALRHEPTGGLGEVAGHLHPCARVIGRSGSVRRRCFVTDGERAILPAFGAFAGGLNVMDRAFAGLFPRAPLAAALGDGRVHAVGWGSLAGD
jgi:uncharacterized protein